MGVVLGVSCKAAIPCADVEVPVRAKSQMAAVVIAIGLGDGQEYLFSAGVGPVGVGGYAETDDDRVAAVVGVVDKEVTVVEIFRVESQPQQTLLAGIVVDPLADIKEWGRE